MADGDWTTPGAYDVAPGVTRIPLPLPNDGLKAVNVYVLTGDDGLTLIDSGWSIPQARDQLVASLADIGYHPGDIRRFLVTHVHRDHYTLGTTLRRDFGMTVALGADERESLEVAMDPDGTPLANQLQLLRHLGADKLAETVARAVGKDHARPEWELPDEWLTAGVRTVSTERALEVVPTPGHTRGHVVFYDVAAGLLFAGDHVLPTITPSIGFEPILSPNPLGDFLASLAVVRSRPDATLLPAHGPVTDSVHARVDELVAHHDHRLAETETAVLDGASTAYEAACLLPWTRRARTLDELDPFNQMLAIAETAAHLVLLTAQGRVLAGEDGDVRRYRPA